MTKYDIDNINMRRSKRKRVGSGGLKFWLLLAAARIVLKLLFTSFGREANVNI